MKKLMPVPRNRCATCDQPCVPVTSGEPKLKLCVACASMDAEFEERFQVWLWETKGPLFIAARQIRMLGDGR